MPMTTPKSSGDDEQRANNIDRQSTEEIIETLRGARGKRVRVYGDDGRVVEARVEVIEVDEPLARRRREAPRGEFMAVLDSDDLDDEIENYGVSGNVSVNEDLHGGWRRPGIGWETFEDGEFTGWDGFDVERVEVVSDE